MKLHFDPFKFDYSLSNSVPVYSKTIPWAEGYVYFIVAFNIGSRFDPENKAGLAHFFEHMPFEGCKGYSRREIDDLRRTVFFGSLNASTSYEGTKYYAKMPAKDFPKALDFFYNFTMQPLLDEESVKRQKSVIEHELWTRYSSPKDAALDKHVRKLMYGSHPFGRTVWAMGWPETIKEVSKTDIVQFQKNMYIKEHMKLVVVGDSSDSLIKKIDGFTKKIPSGMRADVRVPQKWPIPEQREFVVSSRDYFGLSGDAVPKDSVVSVFRAMPLVKNKQLMVVVRSMLWQIFFELIRGEIADTYTPKISFYKHRDHMSLDVEITVAPSNVTKVRELIERTYRELANADSKHKKMFEQCKNLILLRKQMYDLTAEDIAHDSADNLFLENRVQPLQQEYEDAERVSYEDMAEIFREELSSEKLFWCIINP